MGLSSLLFTSLDEHPLALIGVISAAFAVLQVVAFLRWEPIPRGLLRAFTWDSKVLLDLPVAVLGHPTFTAMAWLACGMFGTAHLSAARPGPEVSRHLTLAPSLSLSLLVLVLLIFPLRLLVFLALTCYRKLPLAVHLSHFLVAQRPAYLTLLPAVAVLGMEVDNPIFLGVVAPAAVLLSLVAEPWVLYRLYLGPLLIALPPLSLCPKTLESPAASPGWTRSVEVISITTTDVV